MPPAWKPLGDFTVGFQGRQREALKPSFTVNQNAFVVTEITQFVRFYFVFLNFSKVYRAFSCT